MQICKEHSEFRLNWKTILVLLLFSCTNLHGQETDGLRLEGEDSVRWNKPRLTDFALSCGLIAVGAFGVENHWLVEKKEMISEKIFEWRGNHYCHVDDYIQYAPVAAFIGLEYCGVQPKHGIRKRIMMTASAWIVNGLFTHVTKRIVSERRPDSASENSFPSGHTATVFMGAELVRREYGGWPAVGAYSVAVATSLLRVYNGRHWLNDCLAGAGVGIASANLAFLLQPTFNKWFGIKTRSGVLSVFPTYNPEGKQVCGNIVMQF